MEYEFLLNPIGKPRMTQRDKWLKPPRPEVLKYRLSCQAIQFFAASQNFLLKDEANIIFVLPMPSSWSNKKRQRMCGTKHQSKPDLDNILKFVFDALKPEGDQTIHSIVAKKIWGEEGKIIFIENDDNTEELT
jgi:Holliday junction resolvase RusA-like endonuclease